jgi:hypothetical protein
MMASPWNLKPSRRLQFDGRPLRILLIVALLIAMAWIGPEVIRSIILTVTIVCVLTVGYWEIWQLSVDSPRPPDICTRCQRGVIERVAVSRRGDRFYRCSVCDAPYRRRSREEPWVDASKMKYGDIESWPQSGVLRMPVVFSDGESFDWTRTVGILLRNKRIRQITGDAGRAHIRKHSSTSIWPPSTAQLSKDRRGLWDSDLDG